jgi:hypothetical protein
VVERVALITALILDRPMCLECLSAKAAIPTEELIAILELIEAALAVHRGVGPCRGCRRERSTVHVSQPRLL